MGWGVAILSKNQSPLHPHPVGRTVPGCASRGCLLPRATSTVSDALLCLPWPSTYLPPDQHRGGDSGQQPGSRGWDTLAAGGGAHLSLHEEL